MSDASRVPGLVEGALSNGVRYAVWPDQRDTVASLQVWVRVGSSHERPGKTGLAHMLEHMMFRGTRAVPDGEFDERTESLGLSVNAATWLDYTFYLSTGPHAAIDEMIRLEADRFCDLAITDDAFYPERDVVANERRQVVDANPDGRLGERLNSLSFADTPYAWPTIGWADDIAGYQADDLRDFYRRFYVGQNLLVVATGKLDADLIIPTIESEFGAVRDGQRSETGPFGVRSSADESLTVPVSNERVLLSWPAPARRSQSYASWVVFEELLAAAESSALPTRLEHIDRSAIDVHSSLNVLREQSSLEVDVTLRRGADAESVTDAVSEEIAGIATDVDAEALAGACARVRTGAASGLAETAARAEVLGESWATCDDLQRLLGLVDEVRSVSTDDIARVANELIAGPRTRLLGVPT